MSRDELTAGQYRRHQRLGTTAVYRVTECRGEMVEVEVVAAPGLPAGLRYRFTAEAVRGMTLLDPGDIPASEDAP